MATNASGETNAKRPGTGMKLLDRRVGVIQNTCVWKRRRDAMLMRPPPKGLLPLRSYAVSHPLAVVFASYNNNKGITRSIGGVCVYSPNVFTKLSDGDVGRTHIELHRSFPLQFCSFLTNGRASFSSFGGSNPRSIQCDCYLQFWKGKKVTKFETNFTNFES